MLPTNRCHPKSTHACPVTAVTDNVFIDASVEGGHFMLSFAC